MWARSFDLLKDDNGNLTNSRTNVSTIIDVTKFDDLRITLPSRPDSSISATLDLTQRETEMWHNIRDLILEHGQCIIIDDFNSLSCITVVAATSAHLDLVVHCILQFLPNTPDCVLTI